MVKRRIQVGIIAGTGLDDIADNIVDGSKQIKLCHGNTFGIVGSDIIQGFIGDVLVAIISRHGSGHRLRPSEVNYRANIEALRKLGCTHILATTACGSLVESISPGQLVVPDSFIDRTYCRKGTMYDGSDTERYRGVCHVPMEPAFDPRTSDILIEVAKELEIDIKKGGTIITIEGPRFSTKAESKLYQQWGAHMVNMTTCPEVALAKEAGILYASIAMATDFDCWRDSEERVNVSTVMAVFKRNVKKVTAILLKAIEVIGKQDWDKDIDDLKKVVEGGLTSTEEIQMNKLMNKMTVNR